ncbi:MAG: thioredoxin-disulfide reductase [Candidatus Omnitrophica bacterium CG_4_10_14_0_8_um_filter_44_12]|nr:MAG: thioredoxin-disulfide reductase [Candidatus Omnitrophica bacterium CG_4_10_14_0_8_um_filter_44_12]
MAIDVVIIGAGPAGLTAALYAGRSKLKTRLVEKSFAGGQILLTELIENYPGVYEMKSSKWVEAAKKQISVLSDVELAEDTKVEKIENKDGIFQTHVVSNVTGSSDIYVSRCIIIAAGSQPRRLGVKGEEALIGHGVSYCATCDGPLFKNKDVVMIGGGDAALEEALYLRKFVKSLTICHRRGEFRAAALLQDRIKADKGIFIKWDSVPVEILGKTRVDGIKVKNIKSQREDILHCGGIFIFIGSDPDTGFLNGILDLNAAGYVVTDESMVSSLPGVFAAGDCRARPFNQVVTACSDGAIAAFSVRKFLDNKI